MIWAREQLDTPQVRFSFATAGEGRPTVLLSGAGGWHLTFARLGSELARDRRVIALDPPGQGTTSIQHDGVSFGVEEVVTSLDAFFVAAGVERADVVAHSWGGGYALRLAERHPHRVGRLVLLAPAGVPCPDAWAFRLARRRVLGDALVRWFAGPAMRYLFRMSFADRRRVPRERLDRALEMIRSESGARTLRRDMLRIERSVDWTSTAERLAGVKARTLILWGDEDRVIPVGNLEHFQSIPEVTTVRIQHAGHAVHDDQPDEVLPIVVAFLRGDGDAQATTEE